jgi:uncharacterized protein YuzE
MEKLVRTYYVPEMDTLDIWLDDPDREAESEEVGDGVVAKLDGDGKIIGVEIISASKTSVEQLADLPEDIRNILNDSMKKLATAASRITKK